MELELFDMNIEQISKSGQCFRMNALSNNCKEQCYKDHTSYSIISGDRYLEVHQLNQKFELSCNESEWEMYWRDYFDCSTDYQAIKSQIDPNDTYLMNAITICDGVRILRQDLWEMIVTFIISQQNNIPRIKKCVETLCERYGTICSNFRGESYFAFPSVFALAACSVEELKACNLGYRAKYIKKTAQMLLDEEVSLSAIMQMDYEAAKKELLRLSGVGIKVAQCICLFGLHHIDAFPIDTHIQDMLQENYPNGFPFSRYEGFAGVLQQYGFYYELHKNNSQ